jgi:hypothetical protein
LDIILEPGECYQKRNVWLIMLAVNGYRSVLNFENLFIFLEEMRKCKET